MGPPLPPPSTEPSAAARCLWPGGAGSAELPAALPPLPATAAATTTAAAAATTTAAAPVEARRWVHLLYRTAAAAAAAAIADDPDDPDVSAPEVALLLAASHPPPSTAGGARSGWLATIRVGLAALPAAGLLVTTGGVGGKRTLYRLPVGGASSEGVPEVAMEELLAAVGGDIPPDIVLAGGEGGLFGA